MPPVIAAAILGVVGVGSAVAPGIFLPVLFGTTFAGVSIGNALILGASTSLLGSAVRALTPKPSFGNAGTQGSPVLVKQPVAPWTVQYGFGQLGGVIVYVDTRGANNEYLDLVVVHCSGKIEDIPAMYFKTDAGLEQVPVDGAGDATGTYAGYVHWEKRLGDDAPAPYSSLVSDSGGKWTNDHLGKGHAHSYLRLKWNQDLFPSGIPQVVWDIKGRKVHDVRDDPGSPDSETTYPASANWALCLYDSLSDKRYGLGIPKANLYHDAWVSAANLADEAVALTAGGNELRYTTNGSFQTSAQPKEIISNLLSAGGGSLLYSAGSWFPLGAAWRTPAVTLTDADFLRPFTITGRRSRQDLFNSVRGVFADPESDFQPTNYPPVQDAAAIALDGGAVAAVDAGDWATATAYAVNDAVMHLGRAFLCTGAHTSDAAHEPGVGANWTDDWGEYTDYANWFDLDLPFTTSAATAQRIARIALHRNRRQKVLQCRCKLIAYALVPGDTVYINHSRFPGWSNKTFEVVEAIWSPDKDEKDNPIIAVDLTLQESDLDVYGFTADRIFTRPADSLLLSPVDQELWALGQVSDGNGFYKPRTPITLTPDLPYNGDFEEFPSDQDIAQGWTKDFEGGGGTYARSASPWRGAFAQELHGGITAATAAVASRPFGVKENFAYTFTCRAKIDATHATDGFFFRALWYNDDSDFSRGAAASTNDVAGGGADNFSSVGANVFKLFQAEFTAPAGAKFCRIAVYSWDNPGAARVITVDTVTGNLSTVSADGIADGATNHWAGEAGADVTSGHVNLNRADGVTADPAIGATTWNDVPEMTLTVDCSKVEVAFAGTFVAGLNSFVQARVVVDGSPVSGSEHGFHAPNASLNMMAFTWPVDALTPGSHTFKIQSTTNGSSGETWYSTYRHMTVLRIT